MTISPSSAAKESRLAIEHGVQVPDDEDIRAWCRACGAEDQVPDLIATARAAESAYLEFRRQTAAYCAAMLSFWICFLEEAAVHGAAARRLIIGALQELQLAQQLATSWTRRAGQSYDHGKIQDAYAAREILNRADPGHPFTTAAIRTLTGLVEAADLDTGFMPAQAPQATNDGDSQG